MRKVAKARKEEKVKVIGQAFGVGRMLGQKVARRAKVKRERANRRGKESRKASRKVKERKEKFIRIGAGYVVSWDIGATNVHNDKESEKFGLRLVKLQVRMVEQLVFLRAVPRHTVQLAVQQVRHPRREQ